MSNNDIEKDKWTEIHIKLLYEDWIKVLKWAESQDIVIVPLDKSIHDRADMYMSHAENMLNSEGVKMLLTMADEHLKDQKLKQEAEDTEEKHHIVCPACGGEIEKGQAECTECGIGLNWG